MTQVFLRYSKKVLVSFQAKEKRENDEAVERERREQEWKAEVRNQLMKHGQQAEQEKRLEAEEGKLQFATNGRA